MATNRPYDFDEAMHWCIVISFPWSPVNKREKEGREAGSEGGERGKPRLGVGGKEGKGVPCMEMPAMLGLTFVWLQPFKHVKPYTLISKQMCPTDQCHWSADL